MGVNDEDLQKIKIILNFIFDLVYYLFREVKLMLYPVKKKPLSPEHKKVKEPHIVITSKFGGSGGSNPSLTQSALPWLPKNKCLFPSQLFQEFSKLKSTFQFMKKSA